MKAAWEKTTSAWNDLRIEKLFGLWNGEKIPKLATALGLGCKQVNLVDNVKTQLINFKLYKLFYIIFGTLFFCPWKGNVFSLESIFSVAVFKPLNMIQYIKCFNIVVLFVI